MIFQCHWMSGRVKAVCRNLSKKGSRDPAGQRCEELAAALDMVKRETRVSVGSAVTKPGAVRKDQSYRYPGRVIQRAQHLGALKNTNGDAYTDIDGVEGRKKIESNFFITLNTNRTVWDKKEGMIDAELLEIGRRCVELTLTQLQQDKWLCQYIKMGPKDDHFKHDRYTDVVQASEWTSAVEVGELKMRLHCHIWLTLHHYTQLQVNMPALQFHFKTLYNQHVDHECHNSPDRAKQLRQRGNPYIQVKLLPTSDWAMVMRQYIHKAMTT